MASITIKEALQLGIKAHQIGDIETADMYYTAVLKTVPNHPDANHNLAIIAVGLGKHEEAVLLFEKALHRTKNPQHWLSYITTLIKLGKYDAAHVQVKEAIVSDIDPSRFSAIIKELKKLKELNEKSEPSTGKMAELTKMYQRNQFPELIKVLPEMMVEYSRSVFLHNIYGSTLHRLGKFASAVKLYRNALTIDPTNAEIHNSLGAVYDASDTLDEAKSNFEIAIKLKPKFHQAYFNLANCYKKLGETSEAIQNYNTAINIKPDFIEALNNLGNLQLQSGSTQDAQITFEKILSFQKDNFAANFSLGTVMERQKNFISAINFYAHALESKPNDTNAMHRIAALIKHTEFSRTNPKIENLIAVLLKENSYIRPKDIARATVSLIKCSFDPIAKLRQSELIESSDGLIDLILEISNSSLLISLMKSCPIPDIEIENLLVSIRKKMLLTIQFENFSPTSKFFQFQTALALQCFFNEFIYPISSNENESLKHLEKSIEDSVRSGNPPDVNKLMCLAAYKPLNGFNWVGSFAVSSTFKEVYDRHITAPMIEKNLNKTIKSLGSISNDTSKKVRKQYEANPYPRWERLGLPNTPSSIEEIAGYLGLKIYESSIFETSKPEILVAGCGTGQHPITTASLFKSCKVTAIDISKSSLAYAKRKTQELGINNIEYIHLDIIDVEMLGKKFDIIESAGVLHHMKEPKLGWHALTGCLKKNGLMIIGLYSELARRDITNLRESTDVLKIAKSATDIKKARENIIKNKSELHAPLLLSNDFYSTSGIIDLLFHSQEHCFNLKTINNYLSDLELKFCGFQNTNIVKEFKKMFAAPEDLVDLKKWDFFENTSPDIFGEMYQFWCQKT